MDPPMQDPKTPQRGRREYPASLARDGENRVPLHRRGRSKTYERLEDLLREAGYKETRVFTPEAERLESEAEERRLKDRERRTRATGSGNGKVSGPGVLSFLSGLVQRNDDGKSLVTTSQRTGGRQTGNEDAGASFDSGDHWGAHTPTPTTRAKPAPRRPFTPLITTSDHSSPDSSGHTSTQSSQSPPLRVGHAPDARSKLRHMLSAPNIPRRPISPHPRRSSERAQNRRSTTDAEPPLPKNWLQTVTQAVLGSGSGAHIGGPSENRGRSLYGGQTPRIPNGRRDGSFLSYSSNKRAFTPHTPSVLTTPGVVTTTFVVCRSAPGSRSSSVVRGGSKQKKDLHVCHVPSLGVTTLEGESWPEGVLPSFPSSDNPMHLDSDSDDDSDDDGLDFARLIVPSKRQHSIHSLRKHLHDQSVSTIRANSSLGHAVVAGALTNAPRPGHSSATSSVRRVVRPASAADLPDDSFDDALQQSWHQSRRSSVGETERMGWASKGLPGFDQSTKKKRGALPWTPWNAVDS